MTSANTSGPALSGSAAKRHYKQAVAALPKPRGAIEPTLPERINRLNPRERIEVKSLIRSMKLRKIIKRTLAEAFWAGEQQKAMNQLHDSFALASMPRLQAAARLRGLPASYERALTPSVEAVDLSTRLVTREPDAGDWPPNDG